MRVHTPLAALALLGVWLARDAGAGAAPADAGAHLYAQVGEPAPAQDAPFSARSMIAPPTAGWPTNGGNLSNQRYSPLRRIDRTNVAGLRGVWQARLDGSGVGPRYSGEAQPIVHDGVIYVVTGADDVFALSVDDGTLLWKYEAHLEQNISTICCGWSSRGVAIGGGRVYVGQLDGRMLALDQRTGDVAWSVQAERWQDGYVITSAPLYYDGLVITGFAGAEYAQRGRVKAYDATDGALVWTFYTVPGPGELGHDTWPQDSDVWRYGGGSVWQTPAADPELGLIYFATGNPGPDFNGAVRPGDNLFTASVVALEAETGAYRWHYQVVHHDIWDYDLPTPIVLFDIDVGGAPRKGLAATGKTGWVYLLDRETGEPLLGIEERPVPQDASQATSPTQPYPIGEAYIPQSIDHPPEGFDLINDGRIFTPFGREGAIMKPSQFGGANWPPSSYDPTTGLYYVCAQDRIGLFRGGASFEQEPTPGLIYFGGQFGAVPVPSTGIFAAMDVRSNTVVWSQRWPDTCYSGSVVTAGGVVFVGRNDGRFTALDASNGHKLWEFQTGAGVNAPASVFEHGGEQYVVVYAAGNLFAGSPRGDRVWLFSLSGTLDPVAPPGTERAEASVDGTADVDLDAGRAVYLDACATCHGARGEGAHNGVRLEPPLSLEYVVSTVTDGSNDMPAFATELSADQIRAVAAYVVEVILPGS